MKRIVKETRKFSKDIDNLLKKRNLLKEDFEEFKKNLGEYPVIGDLISGTGGVRKARLKSSSKGKSGGFRVCYYYDQEVGDLFLLAIYPKNKQEDLTYDEKKLLKELVNIIKEK